MKTPSNINKNVLKINTSWHISSINNPLGLGLGNWRWCQDKLPKKMDQEHFADAGLRGWKNFNVSPVLWLIRSCIKR